MTNILNDFQFLLPLSVSWGRINTAGMLGPSLPIYKTNKELYDKDVLDFLILIIFVEHFIILIKFSMSYFIGDVPVWV